VPISSLDGCTPADALARWERSILTTLGDRRGSRCGRRLAALAIIYAIRHTAKPRQQEREPIRIKIKPVLQGRLGWLMAGISAFELGNCAATLLILRATDLLAPSRGSKRSFRSSRATSSINDEYQTTFPWAPRPERGTTVIASAGSPLSRKARSAESGRRCPPGRSTWASSVEVVSGQARIIGIV
jgi:hypothetical protein